MPAGAPTADRPDRDPRPARRWRSGAGGSGAGVGLVAGGHGREDLQGKRAAVNVSDFDSIATLSPVILMVANDTDGFVRVGGAGEHTGND